MQYKTSMDYSGNQANSEGNSSTINPDHEFANDAERDAYFSTQPQRDEMLKGRTLISNGAKFELWTDSDKPLSYDNSFWLDKTAVVRGARGIQGEQGLEGIKIKSAAISYGDLILTMTDESEINAGKLPLQVGVSDDAGFLTTRGAMSGDYTIGSAQGQVPVSDVIDHLMVNEATEDTVWTLSLGGWGDGNKFLALNPTEHALKIITDKGKMIGNNVIDSEYLILQKGDSAIVIYEGGQFNIISYISASFFEGTWLDDVYGSGDKNTVMDLSLSGGLSDSGRDKKAPLNGKLIGSWKPDPQSDFSGKQIIFTMKNNAVKTLNGIGVVWNIPKSAFGEGTQVSIFGSNDEGSTKVPLTDTITLKGGPTNSEEGYHHDLVLGNVSQIYFTKNIGDYNQYIIEGISGTIDEEPDWKEFLFRVPTARLNRVVYEEKHNKFIKTFTGTDWTDDTDTTKVKLVFSATNITTPIVQVQKENPTGHEIVFVDTLINSLGEITLRIPKGSEFRGKAIVM